MANLTEADVNAIFDHVVDHALTLGHFESVNTHEPKNAPQNGLTCAVWVDYIGPYPLGSGLSITTGLLRLMVRIYTKFIQEPVDMIDPNVLTAVSDLIGSYSGNFGIGLPKVRNIDLLGVSGTPLAAQAGYLEMSKVWYRIMTITLPIILDDAWAQVQ